MKNEIVKVEQDTVEARTNAEQLVVKTEGLKITNQSTLNFVIEQVKLIKGSWKFLDAKRRKATKPMDEAKKEVMSWFKPILTALKSRENELKDAEVKYIESRKTDVEMEGAHLTERWYAVVTNKEILMKEHPEFFTEKQAFLDELARASKGKSGIEGLEFRCEKGMSSKSK